MYKFSEIETRRELASFLGISLKRLTYTLYIEAEPYQKFDIAKKSGGIREIYAPNNNLKDIQRRMAKILNRHILGIRLVKRSEVNISHGFEKGKNIITNSEIHRNKKYVLNIDIENFFESIHFGRVRGYFIKNKYFKMNEDVATMLAQLVCHRKKLTQGSPTSPVISNLICNVLDMRILKLCKKFKIDYTRYVDDLTFSTNTKDFPENYSQFFTELEKEIKRAGFSLNESKTRLQYKDSQQTVTGLTVNKKINVKRTFYLQTRAMAHNLYKYGKFTTDNEEGNIRQLEGRFSFINQLDWYHNKKEYKLNYKDFKTKNEYISTKKLNAREKEYQRFLFYKYFWGNPYPLVVTEGKTDVFYIKAALRKYYLEYPQLVQKNKNGDYEYYITFLKRTKRIRYFLNISPHGGDTYVRVINFYIDHTLSNSKRNEPNYYKYFSDKIKTSAINPVILLFDNEGAESPLHKFINTVSKSVNKNSGDLKNNLNKTNPHIEQLIGNVHLMAVPKRTTEENGEIEDLLTNITDELIIDGRGFNKDNKVGYYGKDVLSKYLYDNYDSFDLKGIKPILDNLLHLKMNYE